jgi:Protein of unknown function (DUF3037)
MNHPGFYSVVRFCPDIERGEAVNIGVIVGAPGLGMRVRLAGRNEYVKRRFGAEAFDNTRLTLVKDGLVERLKDVEATGEALAAFGAAEAGKLQLSPPRPMVVKDLDGEVLALFSRLVEDPEIARRERRTPKPDLSPIVKQLVRRNVPIQRRPEVSVPILDEPFTADFAFLNGARNLVKSVGLSGREENALEEASDLGSKGLLLARHADAQGTKSKLVVVADIDDLQLRQRVDRLLSDHEVRFVEVAELPSFADEIERVAH